MAKRKIAHCIKTRDEKGIPHYTPCSREYARNLIKGSCIIAKRRGTIGREFYLVLANGCTVVIDLLTPKQLRANGL
jgi:hypothetical protein